MDGPDRFANMSSSVPDLALSFGDMEFAKWDNATHSMKVDIYGPAWQWENSAEGMKFQTTSMGAYFDHYSMSLISARTLNSARFTPS